jgi:hypothetical protein
LVLQPHQTQSNFKKIQLWLPEPFFVSPYLLLFASKIFDFAPRTALLKNILIIFKAKHGK